MAQIPNTPDDVTTKLKGHGITGSIEGGYPFPLTDTISLETQGQLIVQSIRFDSASDPFTTLVFHDDTGVTGRIGLRLVDNLIVGGMQIQPRIIANFWHTFSGNDSVVFNTVETLSTPFSETFFEIGAGVSARLAEQLSGFAEFSYTTNLDGPDVQAIRGIVGVRFSW